MSGHVNVTRADDVWTLALDRADKRNALSGPIVEELLSLMHAAPLEGARVIVLRGEGRNFSAGFDFSDFEQSSEGDLVLRFIRLELLLQAVATSPCLTVGLAHGRIFGAGVDLIASCRQRFATADTTFRMPGLKFGLVLGTRRFGQIVGAETAASIQEEASTFDAAKALSMGFVHEIVEQAEWPSRVEAAKSKASALPAWSRNALYEVLATSQPDVDLAWLVRSASRPGLKERVGAYLAG